MPTTGTQSKILPGVFKFKKESFMTSATFDDRDGVIWFDGEMVPWREAQIHVLSHGLHYASAVFEGERAYGGNIFHLTEHTERLFGSARVLGFDLPYDVATVDEACREVCRANGIVDGYVRPIAWRGSEMMGVSAQETQIHLSIACWPWPSYFSPEARMKGIRLKTSTWRRPSPETAPVHAKAAGLYMICTMSKHAVEAEGYDDALMLDWRGQVAESTGANIFLVFDDGRLHTPTPDCFLDGITRQTVMALARARGIEIVERAIMPEELADAREIFLTGTAAEVTPVGQIDDHTYTPGEVCQVLMEDYENTVGKAPEDAASAA
jgi:branched-chain amino acid aminotransferase